MLKQESVVKFYDSIRAYIVAILLLANDDVNNVCNVYNNEGQSTKRYREDR